MKKAAKKEKTKTDERIKEALPGDAVQQEFLNFMDFHPAERLSRNLRSLLIEFLMYDGGTESEFLKELLYDLRGLFDLLDAIESDRLREGKVIKNKSPAE